MPVVTRVLLCAVALLAAVAPPASARTRITTSDRPLISSNITPVFTVPGVHPIGARIRGNYMYVTGPDGLTVYDISDPEHPLPAGALPLPHFENEDVDLGGNTLLISNDPSEGVGILYVIDISDPTMPTLASATPNGFIDFDQAAFGADGAVPPGVGHTASCIPGPAGGCQYAYLAGTGQGIAIVDLTDPSAPKFAKVFKPEITGYATHDVQLDGTGLAWIVGYEGSMAYDVTDPLNPKPVYRTDPNVKNTGVAQPGVIPPSANPFPDHVVTDPIVGIPLVGGDGNTPIDFIHHDSLRFPAPAKPAVPGEPAPPATDGNPKTVDSTPSPDAPTATDESRPQGEVKGEKKTSTPAKPKAKKRTSCRRLKSKARRRRCYANRRRARARAKASTSRTSASAAAATNQAAANKTYPAGADGDVVGIVEEDYARPTCEGAGSFQTWKIGDDGILRLLGMWGTEIEALSDGSGFAPLTGLCSAHYFDQRDGLVADAWYEEGTRFLDVSDPTHIKQVGYWIPAKGETWSALFAPNDPTGQTVYALDFVRGIEVLHIDRSGLKKTSAPVRRSWLQKKSRKTRASRFSLSHLSKSSRYGFVCRLATYRALRD